MQEECRVMLKILGKMEECENIVKIFEIVDEKYIIMEMCNCRDLFSYMIKDKKAITTTEEIEEVIDIACQIVKGLQFLSDHDITHRDLKPENILIHKKTETKILGLNNSRIIAKIADFGLSKESDRLKSFVGTPNYIAPEIIELCKNHEGEGQYDRSVDVWSFGLVLYEMVTKKQLFNGDNLLDIFKRIIEVKKNPVQLDISCELTELREIIQKCLSIDPKQRPCFEDILVDLISYKMQLQADEICDDDDDDDNDVNQICFSSESDIELELDAEDDNSEITDQEQSKLVWSIINNDNRQLDQMEFSLIKQESEQIEENIEKQEVYKNSEIKEITKIELEIYSKKMDSLNNSYLNKQPQSNLFRNQELSQNNKIIEKQNCKKYERFSNYYIDERQLKEIQITYVDKIVKKFDLKYADKKFGYNKKVLSIHRSFSGILSTDNIYHSLAPIIFHKILLDQNIALLQTLSEQLIQKNIYSKEISFRSELYDNTYLEMESHKVLKNIIDASKKLQLKGSKKSIIETIKSIFSQQYEMEIFAFICFQYITSAFNQEGKHFVDFKQTIEKQIQLSLSCGIILDIGPGVPEPQQQVLKTAVIYIRKSFCSSKIYNILLTQSTMDIFF